MAIRPEELAAANRHLEGTGMPRYGWLPHGLRVAFHKAGIPPAQLRELGGHFARIGDAKALAEAMKAAAAKLATSPQAAFQHLLTEAGKKAGVSSGTAQPTRPLISLAKPRASTTPATTHAAAAPTTSRAPPAALVTAPQPKAITRPSSRADQKNPRLVAQETNAIAKLKQYLHPELFRALRAKHADWELANIGYKFPKEAVDEEIKQAAQHALGKISKRTLELKPEERLEYLKQILSHLRLAGFDSWVSSKGEVRRHLPRIARVAASADTRFGGNNHATPEEIGKILYKLFGRRFWVEKPHEYFNNAVVWTKKGMTFGLDPKWMLPLVETLDLAHFDVGTSNYITDEKSPRYRGITVITPKTQAAEAFLKSIKKPRLLERPRLKIRGWIERL